MPFLKTSNSLIDAEPAPVDDFSVKYRNLLKIYANIDAWTFKKATYDEDALPDAVVREA